MKYNESTFYKQMHAVFPGFIKRVENELEVGTPDVYFSSAYATGWMELKCHRGDRARGKVSIPFRPGQYAWLRQNWQYCGLSMLAVWGADGYYFFVNQHIQIVYDTRTLFLERALKVKELNRESVIAVLEMADCIREGTNPDIPRLGWV